MAKVRSHVPNKIDAIGGVMPPQTAQSRDTTSIQ